MKWGAGLILLVASAGCTRSNPSLGLPGNLTIGGFNGGVSGGGTSGGTTGGTVGGSSGGSTGGTSGGSTVGGTSGGSTVGGSSGGSTGGSSGGSTGGSSGGSIGGTSGGGTSGGGTSGGGTSGGGGSCDSCEQVVLESGGACESTLDACLADAKCTALIQCIQGCADNTCLNTCANNAGPTAVNKFTAVGNCICSQCANQCAAECGSSGTTSGGSSGTSGGSGGTSGGSGEEACDMCLATTAASTCKTESESCGNDASCAMLWDCVAGCAFGDSACVTTCKSGRAAATLQKYDSLTACVCGVACHDACGSILPHCGG